MWNGVTLIVDEVTLSGKGEIEVYSADVVVWQRNHYPRRRFLQTANATRIKGGFEECLSWRMNRSSFSVELRASATDDSPGTISGCDTCRSGGSPPTAKKSLFPARLRFPASGVRLLARTPRARGYEVFAPVSSVDGYRIEAELPDTLEGVEAAALVRVGKRELVSQSSSKHLKPSKFPAFEKCAGHSSPLPRSSVRAHTRKLEPSSEGASSDGGFDVALTATEAMAAAEATCQMIFARTLPPK